MTNKFCGSCLCEKVKYQCTSAPIIMVHCHCKDCRKIGASGHASLFMVPETSFTITGETSSYTKAADSNNLVTRHFCPNCSSYLYGTNPSKAGMVMLTASSLDNPEEFKAQIIVYKKSSVSWDKVDPSIHAFDQMPDPEAMKNIMMQKG